MHQILVVAGWWTAISVCAVPVWTTMLKLGDWRARRATSSPDASHGSLRKRSA